MPNPCGCWPGEDDAHFGDCWFSRLDGQARGEVRALYAALRETQAAVGKYGTHLLNCIAHDSRGDNMLRCDCGLHQARGYCTPGAYACPCGMLPPV